MGECPHANLTATRRQGPRRGSASVATGASSLDTTRQTAPDAREFREFFPAEFRARLDRLVPLIVPEPLQKFGLSHWSQVAPRTAGILRTPSRGRVCP